MERAGQHRADRQQFLHLAGVEVNAVQVDELRDPGREFPRAMFVAAALVLAIFVFPTLAISWVIPTQTISLTAGVMQAFDAVLKLLHLGFALPVIALALAIGALGGMIAWLDGPSEGLLNIGREQGYLALYFQKVNDKGIQMHILIGFVPPSQFGHSSPLLYGLLILSGILALGVIPPMLLEWRRRPDWKASR